ncbi:thiol:disulfide interchange protein [Gallibacterium genomosp. 3]|uniref:Thiol:disulfide interchange protein n=1 Tax=Gallibacterium genomosp. 3 TaxID=505345 RepID=A0A1A7NNI7_9PAST|nr:DsbA family protein [Gallibacterium genomosp. 3]OBW91076.1 thiol:disulfide interchange protein [Gallibacterium genomosp. 3]
MKKVLLVLTGFLVAFMSQFSMAANFSEGRDYDVLTLPQSEQKEVIEFFSFYCPHCYDYEMKFHIPEKIKQSLPADVSFKQYHVNFLGGQSANLTRAWALAMAIGAEDKVRAPLFEAAQQRSLNSMDDIRKIFVDSGIDGKEFDSAINSFAVNALVAKQEKAAETFKVRGVPDFYINGKYHIATGNDSGFSEVKTLDDFIQRYVDLTQFLLKK